MESSTNSLDDASADGSAESAERASLMETRLQAQEDEITLLKASLADALRRIRLHDRLLPVLKQQLVAVNPAAARLINQVCCHEDETLSPSLGVEDGLLLCSGSQSSRNVAGRTNGHAAGSPPAEPRPTTAERATQTEASEGGRYPEPNAAQGRADLSEAALPQRAKLHRAPTVEDEDDEDLEDDDEEAAEQDKELSFMPSVEEPPQASAVVGLRDESRSPEEADDKTLGPSSSAPSPVRQEPLKPLIRRNSEKLGNVKRQLKRLDKKAASSASLLTHSPSLEKSDTHVVACPPCPTLLFNPFVFLSPQSCQGASCQRR